MPSHLIQSALLQSVAGLNHGFTTKATTAAENAALEKLVSTGNQVHKDHFLWLNDFERRRRDADGAGTTKANFFVGAYSADCTPILLAAQDGRGKTLAVMAVHAGWRGTALGIAGKAATELQRHLAQPEIQLYAAIGPCISFESFEVGPEVVAAFPHALEQGLARLHRIEEGKQKYFLNLPGENARQLRNSAAQLGIKIHVDALAHCTLREKDTFPSYRRDHQNAGRILSFIAFGTESSAPPW